MVWYQFTFFAAKRPPLAETISFMDEATILMRFDHPNVLSLVGIAIKDNIPKIMTPFMANSDLRTFLKGNQKVLRTFLCLRITKITKVNLPVFVYRLFHEDFSSIIGTNYRW